MLTVTWWVDPQHLYREKPFEGAVEVVPAVGTTPAGLALSWFRADEERLHAISEAVSIAVRRSVARLESGADEEQAVVVLRLDDWGRIVDLAEKGE